MQGVEGQFPCPQADPNAGLRHGLYNGRRHYVFNARGEQVGKRRLNDMPGQPRKRWESVAAFSKRTIKAGVR